MVDDNNKEQEVLKVAARASVEQSNMRTAAPLLMPEQPKKKIVPGSASCGFRLPGCHGCISVSLGKFLNPMAQFHMCKIG